MKNLILVLLSGVTGSLLTILVLGIGGTVRAGGAPACSSMNGDVNADGRVDLSDAVTILGNLFLGNPTELVPICAQHAAASSLPATGQTKCYGELEGTVIEVPCESAICSGQDGFYLAGCASEGRFVDNGDGTVTDNCTGLMWQKDTADTNGDGQVRNDGSDVVSWCDALAYCEKLSFAGHDDWRLPNVRELQSIVDYGRFGPSIDPVFGALSIMYWSSTSVADGPEPAWGVGFFDGFVDNFGKGNLSYVRAVRNAP